MKKITTNKLLKKIRKHCLNCCGGNRKEVELCPDTECELHKYRMGQVKEEKDELVDLIE